MKKLNKQLLAEELKKFRMISEYSFYTGEPNNIDEDDEDESGDNSDIDSATQEVGAELGVDDSKTSNGGETPQDSPEAPLDATNADSQANTPVPSDASAAPAPTEAPASDEVDIDVTSLVQGSEEAKEAAESADHKTSELLSKFGELEHRVSSMSELSDKIDALEKEVIKRNPTPVEKLEMRSLSSYPYNIKLTDFWSEKEGQYDVINDKPEEYILTQDDVDNDYIETNIGKSFDADSDEYEEEDI
jgi:hypothetical protein